MQIEINGLAVEVSEKALDAYDAHSAYCSAGTDWLISNDPECKRESELIQEVLDSLNEDYKLAVDNMLSIVHDSLMDGFDLSMHSNNYFELIDAAT